MTGMTLLPFFHPSTAPALVSASVSAFAFAFAPARPLIAGIHSRPEGRRAGRAPFSDRAMDGESENPGHPPGCDFTSSGKAVFFGYFLFGQKKKVARAKARNGFVFRKGTSEGHWMTSAKRFEAPPAFAGMAMPGVLATCMAKTRTSHVQVSP